MRVSELDARGLNCPLPVLKARKRLLAMAPGDRLVVLATDARSPVDLAALCAAMGHRVLASSSKAGVHRVEIEHG
jgi:tRNA 2-thiouridine synthesizing protein A